jgi:hypothetical protein
LEFAYFLGSGTISTSIDIVSLGAPVLTYLLYTNFYVDILHTRTPFFVKQRLFTVIIVCFGKNIITYNTKIYRPLGHNMAHTHPSDKIRQVQLGLIYSGTQPPPPLTPSPYGIW